MRILLLSDTHYQYTWKHVDDIFKTKFDYCVCLGDVENLMINYLAEKCKEQNIPIYVLDGNHDNYINLENEYVNLIHMKSFRLGDYNCFGFGGSYAYKPKNNSEMLWTQKNGEEINIKDMTDSHIQNTINMLKRRDCDSIDEYWIMTFEAEQRTRKEKRAKVMTNKEVINNMSTEALAKYLFNRGNCQEYCYGICAFQDDCDYDQEDNFCIAQISKWLESENEEKLR